MNDKHTPLLPCENERCEENFRELWHAIDNLRIRKQNQISALVWMPFVVWLISATVGGVWWAATMNANQEALKNLLVQHTAEAYPKTSAEAALALRDKDIKYNRDGIEEIKKGMDAIHEELKGIREAVSK